MAAESNAKGSAPASEWPAGALRKPTLHALHSAADRGALRPGVDLVLIAGRTSVLDGWITASDAPATEQPATSEPTPGLVRGSDVLTGWGVEGVATHRIVPGTNEWAVACGTDAQANTAAAAAAPKARSVVLRIGAGACTGTDAKATGHDDEELTVALDDERWPGADTEGLNLAAVYGKVQRQLQLWHAAIAKAQSIAPAGTPVSTFTAADQLFVRVRHVPFTAPPEHAPGTATQAAAGAAAAAAGAGAGGAGGAAPAQAPNHEALAAQAIAAVAKGHAAAQTDAGAAGGGLQLAAQVVGFRRVSSKAADCAEHPRARTNAKP